MSVVVFFASDLFSGLYVTVRQFKRCVCQCGSISIFSTALKYYEIHISSI